MSVPRQIIQITTVLTPAGFFTSGRLLQHALCNDGTVWWCEPWGGKEDWERVEHDIPQEDDE